MNTIKWLCIIVSALLWACPAWSSSRGVFVNGKAHYIYIEADSSDVFYKSYTVNSDVNNDGTLSNSMLVPKWDPDSPDKEVDNPGCNRYSKGNGTGIAVFNNLIFFTFTAQKQQEATADTWPFVVAFDLAANNFVSAPICLGSKPLHSDNKAGGRAAGAAIAVLNNTLYVFTDTNTFTSADGKSWASHPALITGSSGNTLTDYQVEDAVTIYPSDSDPKLLLLLGYSGSQETHYDYLSAVTWNGQFGTASDYSPTTAQTSLGPKEGYYIDSTSGLLAGTAKSPGTFVDGAKAASIQVFAYNNYDDDNYGNIFRLEYNYQTTPGKWTVDPNHIDGQGGIDTVLGFPWYTDQCSDAGTQRIQRQHLVLNYYTCTDYGKTEGCKDHSWKSKDFLSDAMVPQSDPNPSNKPANQGWINTSCSDWGGTYTQTDLFDTSADAVTLRKYWQLLGVVLGAPPFAINNVRGTELGELSNVEYGTDADNSVSHTQEWENVLTFSAGLEVKAGLLDDVLGIEDQFDVGYKHAWLSENEDTSTWSKNFFVKMGTDNVYSEDVDDLDRFGWGIFAIPNIRVQDFALYSYDYDINQSGTGTYLGQDLHSTQVLNQDNPTVHQFAFDLTDPGGAQDTIPGLFTGMQGLPIVGTPGQFPKSTDLASWNAVSWDASDLWDVQIGPLSPGYSVLQFVSGSNTGFQFTQSEEQVNTSGQTNSVEVKNSLSFGAETGLGGFKANLTAGYDGNFGTKVSNTTSFGSDISASLGMKACSDPSCYKLVTIDPYLLKATDANAPWIPTGFSGQLPWCITWRVTNACTNDNQCVGTAPLPQKATGTVIGKSKKNDKTLERLPFFGSDYHVKHGEMGWVDENGNVSYIPISADQFDPTLGAAVSVNGLTWSSTSATGDWNRHGDVWVFETHHSLSPNAVTLKLDFGDRSWDFDISNADLSSVIKASQGAVQLGLTVNNSYGFTTSVPHSVHMDWNEKVPATQNGQMELTRYRGSYNSNSSGANEAFFKGALPANLDFFGDFGIEVNGQDRIVPLIAKKNLESARKNGTVIKYDKGGTELTVDFGEKKWSVDFHNKSFSLLHTPRSGVSRICVKVGGASWFNGVIPVYDYTTKLKYHR